MKRSFADKFLASMLSLVFLVVSLPFLTGCNTALALQEVQRFEPVIVNALALACAFTSDPLCATGQATIQTDITVVVNTWGDFNAAKAAGESTQAAWNALDAAFTTFTKDSQAIFALARIVNPAHQADVNAAVAAAEVLLSAIEVAFPASPSLSVTRTRAFAVSSRIHDQQSLTAWEKDYNSRIDAIKKANPSVNLKHVHIHKVFVRAITVGIAK